MTGFFCKPKKKPAQQGNDSYRVLPGNNSAGKSVQSIRRGRSKVRKRAIREEVYQNNNSNVKRSL